MLEMDHCLSNPCDANAICTNTDDHSFTCKCKAGFSGNGIQCKGILRKSLSQCFILCVVQIYVNLFFYFEVVVDYTAECSSYVWLNESDRNENYSGRTDQCDYQQISNILWYRFGGQAGIKIATACTGHGYCGTASTGWMLGSHPTVSEGKVNRTVCYSSWYYNCCWQSNSIEVINCGNYFVYNLRKTPSCTYRYCGSFN